MSIAHTESGTYYALRSGNMYYTESDWDGDCFTYDVRNASLRKEPWTGGRGPSQYVCVRVEITVVTRLRHPEATPRFTTVRGKPKVYYKCSVCGSETKRYASIATAYEKWLEKPAVCRTVFATVHAI